MERFAVTSWLRMASRTLRSTIPKSQLRKESRVTRFELRRTPDGDEVRILHDIRDRHPPAQACREARLGKAAHGGAVLLEQDREALGVPP